MIDPTDWFDTPKSVLLAPLRTLWWLAWDFCVQTVGWSIGWCVLRVLTLGRYPEERLGGVDEADGVRGGGCGAGDAGCGDLGGWRGLSLEALLSQNRATETN